MKKLMRATATAAVFALAVALGLVVPAQDAEAQSGSCPAGTIQAQIDAATSGGTITVASGTYRECFVVNKPLTINFAEGAVVKGSDDWSPSSSSTWSRTTSGGNYVYTSSKLQPFAESSTEAYCDPAISWNRCKAQAQVFLDGVEQTQIKNTGDPKCFTDGRPGQFKVTDTKKVVLGCNPANKTVEVTTRMRWAEIASDNVTINNMTGTHAATPAQKGGVENYGYDNVTIADGEFSHAHAAGFNSEGVAQGYGPVTLTNNHFHHNGQIGVTGSGMLGMTATGNTINNNNTQGFDYLWEAGGLKIIGAHDPVWQNNTVYNNKGPGLWCDILCVDGIISGNTVHHNDHSGIMWEVSDGAEIYSNTVYENGWEYDAGNNFVFGAGILISSSMDTEVYNNTVAWNNDGITVIEQDRRGDWDTRRAINNYVHDNDILAEDCYSYHCIASGFVDDTENNNGVGLLGSTRINDASQNNTGANNEYWYPNAEVTPEIDAPYRYYWGEEEMEYLSEYNATPGEENGRYLTTTEKNAIVTATGIPASPESH